MDNREIETLFLKENCLSKIDIKIDIEARVA
jgi:hypothetical protein